METQNNTDTTITEDHTSEHPMVFFKNRSLTQQAFEKFVTAAKRYLTPDEWKRFKALSAEQQARGFIDAYQFGLKPSLKGEPGPQPVEERKLKEDETAKVSSPKSPDVKAWENLGKPKLGPVLAEALGEPEKKTAKIEAGVPIPPLHALAAEHAPKIEAGIPIPPITHGPHTMRRKVDPKSPRGLLTKLAKANIGDSVLLTTPKGYKGSNFPQSMATLVRAVAGKHWYTIRKIDANTVRVWKIAEPTKN